MPRKNQIALTLPPQMREALDRAARDTGRTRSELIREFIARGLATRQDAPKTGA